MIYTYTSPIRSDLPAHEILVAEGQLSIGDEIVDLSSIGMIPVGTSHHLVPVAFKDAAGDYHVRVLVPYGANGDPVDHEQMPAAPVLAPSTDPNDYPLTALEFDAALVRLGIDRDDVAPAIRTIFAQDIDAMADSLARWWNLKTMTRDNPVMGMLKPVFNVTDAQIDTAWMATVARRG